MTTFNWRLNKNGNAALQPSMFKAVAYTSLAVNMVLLLHWATTPQSAPTAQLHLAQHESGGTANCLAGVNSSRTVFDSSLDFLDNLAERLASGKDYTSECNGADFGKRWGDHRLCAVEPLSKPCHFYSFGINEDFSFDQELANRSGCYGFAADPTVIHPAVLPGTNNLVTFHYLAAKSYHDKDNSKWMAVTSVPALRKWLGHDRIEVLKMDCEGCECSLARDILAEDPTFFHRVGQFAMEAHYSKRWITGNEELHALSALLELVAEAGMSLVSAQIAHCESRDEATGLLPELLARPGLKLGDGHCHNYLFARLPKP